MQYYCPMHPAIVSDKPGICPKCGMKLNKKNIDSQSPVIKLLDTATYEKQIDEFHLQAWVITNSQRKEIVQKFRETSTDSIIKNRLNDSSFMNMMLKGTHHLLVRITDKTDKEVGDRVQIQIIAPSGKKISNTLNAMSGYFESSVTLNEKGTHKFLVHITIKGKSRETQFNYAVE